MDTDKVERLRERLLVCPICMDEYNDPRLLPCHHSVCLECVTNMLRSATISQRVFRCPQCRADVCVPRGGIKNLPINFYILSLQEELGTRSCVGMCEICQRQWLAAQFHCQDCHKDICRFCIHEHRLFTHKERMLNIQRLEAVSQPSVSTTSQCTCALHTEELLQLFCATCDCAVCITCACGPHKRHCTFPLAVRLRDARKELQKEFDRLSAERRRVQAAQRELNTSRKAQCRSTAMTLHEIEARAERLHTLVENMAAEQRQLLNGDGQGVSLSDCQQDITNYLDKVDKALSFLEDLQDGDVCLELLEFYNRYRQQLDDCSRSLKNCMVKTVEMIFSPGRERRVGRYILADFGVVKTHAVKFPVLEELELERRWWSRVGVWMKKRLQERLTLGMLALLAGLAALALGMYSLMRSSKQLTSLRSYNEDLLALILLSTLGCVAVLTFCKVK